MKVEVEATVRDKNGNVKDHTVEQVDFSDSNVRDMIRLENYLHGGIN